MPKDRRNGKNKSVSDLLIKYHIIKTCGAIELGLNAILTFGTGWKGD
jgi:hypothetical protein